MYMASGPSLLSADVFFPFIISSTFICSQSLLPLFFSHHLSASFCLHLSIFVFLHLVLLFFFLFCLHFSGCLVSFCLHICVFCCFSAFVLLRFIILSAPTSKPPSLSLLSISLSSVTSKAVAGNWTKTGSIREKDGVY